MSLRHPIRDVKYANRYEPQVQRRGLGLRHKLGNQEQMDVFKTIKLKEITKKASIEKRAEP